MTTLNPADKKNASVVLSNGNLTSTGGDSGGNNWVRSTTAQTGKVYCEMKADVMANTVFGIADLSAMTYPGANAKSFGLYGNGSGGINATFPAWGVPFATGNIVSMAVDLTAKKVWFRVNGGNWNAGGTADPATGVGGFDISAYTGTVHYFIVSGNNTVKSTVNFGATAYAYAIPSGFASWDVAPTPPTTGMKIWTGATWVLKPLKVWSGSAWVTKPVKVWNGSAWVVKPAVGGPTAITRVQGASGNTASSVTTLSVPLPANVGNGNTVVVYYGVNGVTGTITDDKGNTYTNLPTDTIGGYSTGVAYAVNVTNAPKTITLNQSGAAAYPFLIAEEFSNVLSYDDTIENVRLIDVASVTSGNLFPAVNGELIFTAGWGGNGGPITVDALFAFIRDGGAGFSNVSTGFLVQPVLGAVGATWTFPSAMPGMSRVLSFKPR